MNMSAEVGSAFRPFRMQRQRMKIDEGICVLTSSFCGFVIMRL